VKIAQSKDIERFPPELDSLAEFEDKGHDGRFKGPSDRGAIQEVEIERSRPNRERILAAEPQAALRSAGLPKAFNHIVCAEDFRGRKHMHGPVLSLVVEILGPNEHLSLWEPVGQGRGHANGSTPGIAADINPAGDIVGRFVNADAKTCPNPLVCPLAHGFLLRGDEFTTIDFPDALFSSAIGINPPRLIGMLLIAIASLYYVAARTNLIPYIQMTVPARAFVVICLVIFVLLGPGRRALLLFAALDVRGSSGVLWRCAAWASQLSHIG
jgi:hypothetical protein